MESKTSKCRVIIFSSLDEQCYNNKPSISNTTEDVTAMADNNILSRLLCLLVSHHVCYLWVFMLTRNILKCTASPVDQGTHEVRTNVTTNRLSRIRRYLTGAPSTGWYGIASDSTGKYLAAADNNGGIWTSTDYGVTWVESASAPIMLVGKQLQVIALESI